MNAATKKRLIIVTIAIVMVLAVILAVVGGGSAAKAISLEQAASGEFNDQRIQVTGNVVANSYETSEDAISFKIYDSEAEQDKQDITLDVVYEGGVSATFGNDVTAICTGKIGDDGVLRCNELVTKCPSKYESGTEALEVARMLDYGDAIVDKPVKVRGTVVPGTQRAAGSDERFQLADGTDASVKVGVAFDGALSDDTIADGAKLVLTGNMNKQGMFCATNVSIEE